MRHLYDRYRETRDVDGSAQRALSGACFFAPIVTHTHKGVGWQTGQKLVVMRLLGLHNLNRKRDDKNPVADKYTGSLSHSWL